MPLLPRMLLPLLLPLAALPLTSALSLRSGSDDRIAAGEHKLWTPCHHRNEYKWDPKGDLRFIHIPRTGGTTMEGCDLPKQYNLTKWDPAAHKLPGKGADAGHMIGRLKPFPELEYYKKIGLKKARKCYIQHAPPAAMAREQPDNTVYPYGKDSNFCVVRHPYDRLISQFGFATSMYKEKWGFFYKCNEADLNAYLLDRLKTVKEGALDFEDCHFIPESTFVYGYNSSTGRALTDQKWCDHVLHFERLGPEFNMLMEKFGYGIRINATDTAATGFGMSMSSKGACSKLTAASLSPEVRALANEVYEQDFELLGYKPM